MPLVVFHAIRSFLRRSVMRPSQLRLLNQIFSCQRTLSSPSRRTLSTRCMNFGYWSKLFHASYAVSTEAATSVQRWIGRRRVFFCPPPPPPPPPGSAFDATFPSMPWPPVSCDFAPSAAFSPSRCALSSPFFSVDSESRRTRPGPFAAATAPTALSAAGSSSSFVFSAARIDEPLPLPLLSLFPLSPALLSCSAMQTPPRFLNPRVPGCSCPFAATGRPRRSPQSPRTPQ